MRHGYEITYLCDWNRSYFLLPLRGPQQEEKGRVSGQQRSFSEQLNTRGADRYVHFGMCFSATPVRNTPAKPGLSHPTGWSPCDWQVEEVFGSSPQEPGGRYGELWLWTNGSTEIPPNQAGLQSNKTHQWGVSQKFVSSHTVKVMAAAGWLELIKHLAVWGSEWESFRGSDGTKRQKGTFFFSPWQIYFLCGCRMDVNLQTSSAPAPWTPLAQDVQRRDSSSKESVHWDFLKLFTAHFSFF